MDISRQAGQEHMYKEDGRPGLLLRRHESLHHVHQLSRSDITGELGQLDREGVDDCVTGGVGEGLAKAA